MSIRNVGISYRLFRYLQKSVYFYAKKYPRPKRTVIQLFHVSIILYILNLTLETIQSIIRKTKQKPKWPNLFGRACESNAGSHRTLSPPGPREGFGRSPLHSSSTPTVGEGFLGRNNGSASAPVCARGVLWFRPLVASGRRVAWQ